MADADTPSFDELAADLAGEPEATDVKEETVEQEPTTEESSTEETTEPEAEETEDGEPSEEPDETEESDDKPSKAEERKQQLNTEIRDLVTQRRELMSEVERLNSQVYAPQSVDEIMAQEGISQAEARIAAMEQRQELAEYNTQVAEAQLVIGSQSDRVLRDFPMFNPDSPEFNSAIADRAASQLSQAILRDPNTGAVTGSNIDIYNYYETLAAAATATATENQLKGQRNAEQMAANAEPSSSAVPATPIDDPFLAGLTKGYEGKLGS
jgi:hypothetical protein